ncbi:glycosyl hydrolase 108 family protein [Komagataeibacter xylinus]|uniref:glycosyl hydrolase 108 family protein n=1 Tax=Komagataeibacter xylinus TaxID=28448 RepID=UPI00280BC938|nr:glycosyl hydrolase 108 family protein [Komagataeibacter xylinus]
MQTNFHTIINGTAGQEGLYQCLRDDGGNWTGGAVGHGFLVGTMRGISAPTMVRWLGGNPARVTRAVMQAIDVPTFAAIARAYYWNAMDCAALPAGVDQMVFDFGFNSGNGRSIWLLQQAIGLTGRQVDGDIGPVTLDALEKELTFPPHSSEANAARAIVRRLNTLQETAYRSFEGFDAFGAGWLRRLEWRTSAALALIDAVAPAAA